MFKRYFITALSVVAIVSAVPCPPPTETTSLNIDVPRFTATTTTSMTATTTATTTSATSTATAGPKCLDGCNVLNAVNTLKTTANSIYPALDGVNPPDILVAALTAAINVAATKINALPKNGNDLPSAASVAAGLGTLISGITAALGNYPPLTIPTLLNQVDSSLSNLLSSIGARFPGILTAVGSTTPFPVFLLLQSEKLQLTLAVLGLPPVV